MVVMGTTEFTLIQVVLNFMVVGVMTILKLTDFTTKFTAVATKILSVPMVATMKSTVKMVTIIL
jgi:hypothetical protein